MGLPLVAWKVIGLNPSIASVRYRCLFPLLSLNDAGWRSVVFEEGEALIDEQVAAAVFVKSFTDADVTLARRLHNKKIPIFLDLCDNVFVKRYAADALVSPVGRFDEMAYLASAIVVPTEELARTVWRRLSPERRIEVIPDQLESLSESRYFASSRQSDPRLNRHLISRKYSRGASPPLQRLVRFARWLGSKANRSILSPSGTTIQTELKLTQRECDKPRGGRKRLIWFGTHGASYSTFGMGTIQEVIPSLIELNKTLPLELLVVSNNEEKFRTLAKDLPFPTTYRPWGLLTIFEDLASSDVCVLPNPRDAFSVCKSPNRAVLALSMGVPVVATGIPSLAPLKDCIITDDWLAGLHIYLTDADRRARDLRKAADVIAEYYSAQAVCSQWLGLLEEFVDPRLASAAHITDTQDLGDLKTSPNHCRLG